MRSPAVTPISPVDARDSLLRLAEGIASTDRASRSGMSRGYVAGTPSANPLAGTREAALHLFFTLLTALAEASARTEITDWRMAVARWRDTGVNEPTGARRETGSGRRTMTSGAGRRETAIRLLAAAPFSLPSDEEDGEPHRAFEQIRLIAPEVLLEAIDSISRRGGLLGARERCDLTLLRPRDLGLLYEGFSPYRLTTPPSRDAAANLAWVIDDDGRKASGSYYTPEPVARHIVESALQPLLRDANGARRDPLSLRILDPAMGSGFFLLEAAEQLYRHAAYGTGQIPASIEDPGRIRTAIVSRCLFGADRDPTAVRIARLSLSAWKEGRIVNRVPDSLRRSLCRGNALTGRVEPSESSNAAPSRSACPAHSVSESSRLYTRKSSCQEEESGGTGTDRLDPLHWADRFPELPFHQNAGFDAVVGNPPYDNSRGGLAHNPDFAAMVRYARSCGHYRIYGAVDLYRLFLQRSRRLCRDGGVVSMIVPRTLLGDRDARLDRRILLHETEILAIDDFPFDDAERRVFPSAGLAVCVVTFRKSPPASVVPVRRWPDGEMRRPPSERRVPIDLIERFWPEEMPVAALEAEEWELLRRIAGTPWICRLSEIADAGIGEVNSGTHAPFLTSRSSGSPLIRGADVSPYAIRPVGERRRRLDSDGFLGTLSGEVRGAAKWSNRRVVKQAIRNITLPKRLIAGLSCPGEFLADSTDYFIPRLPHDPRYLLALLNSSTVPEWLFQAVSTNNNVNLYQVRHVPIPRFRFGVEEDSECLAEGRRRIRRLVEEAERIALRGALKPEHAEKVAGHAEWEAWVEERMKRATAEGVPIEPYLIVIDLVEEMTALRERQERPETILETAAWLASRRAILDGVIDRLVWRLYGIDAAAAAIPRIAMRERHGR